MQFEIDTARAKSIARAIQKRCKTAGAPVAYGQALDGLAAGLGLTDWNTLAARLKAEGSVAAAPHPTALHVPGEAHSDDHAYSCTFDAAIYLAGHKADPALADTLRSLILTGFADTHTVDHFVRAAEDPGSDVEAMLDHCRASDGVGFSASIDEHLALTWIRTQRPGAFFNAIALLDPHSRERLQEFDQALVDDRDELFFEPQSRARAEAMLQNRLPDPASAAALARDLLDADRRRDQRQTPIGDAPGGDAPDGDAPDGDAPDGDAPDGDAPVIRARARSDDGALTASFDAAPYLASLTRTELAQTLRDLARDGWGDGYAADEVARARAEAASDLAAVIDHSADTTPVTGETVGFTVEIDRADAIAWLLAHDWDLLILLVSERTLETDDRETARAANLRSAVRPMSQRSRLSELATGTAPHAPDPDPAADLGGNTLIGYQYRDASNYKARRQVVLQGPLSDAEIDEIKARLDEGEYFIPGQVGLDDLQDSFSGCLSWWDPEQDHVWHELEDLERTDRRPTSQMTGRDLLQAFREVTWNTSYEPEGYARMVARHRAHHGPPECPREPIAVWGESEPEAASNALAELPGLNGYGPHPMMVYIRRTALDRPEPVDARGYRFVDAHGRDAGVVAFQHPDGSIVVHGAVSGTYADLDWPDARTAIETEATRLALQPLGESR